MPGVFPISDLSGGTGYPWLPPQYNATLDALGYATGPKPTTPAPAVTTPAGATAARGGAFDINPPGQIGSGSPFGGVPGPISYPTTPYKEAANIYSGLPGLTDAAGKAVMDQITGEFSQFAPELWNIANTYGVQSGQVPNSSGYSQLIANKFFGNQIDKMMQQRQLGIGNYNALLAELGRMGVDPNLAAQIADRNATYKVAPTNPTQALMDLFGAYANRGANAGRSPAGGTGAYMNPYFSPAATRGPQAGTIAPPIAPPITPRGPGSFNLDMGTEDDFINRYLDEIAPRPGMYDWNTPTIDTYGYGGGGIPDNTYYNPTTDSSVYDPFGDTGFGGYGNFNDYNYDPLLEFDDSEFWGGGY